MKINCHESGFSFAKKDEKSEKSVIIQVWKKY